jgi:hypothetical protein
VVTGNGDLLHASAKENHDLFWGVRGGGGNFGVVTSFEFRLHPMQREVIAGEVSFPIARAADVLGMFASHVAAAPDELYMDPALILPPGGRPGSVSLEICYSGEARDAERVLAPIRKLGTPDRDTIKAQNYVDVQRANDTGDNRAMGTYLKGGFVSQISDKLVTAIATGIPADPNRMTVLFFQHCGGAAGRVAENATAFAQRDSLANMMVVTGWRIGAADAAVHMQAARDYWKSLEPFARGFYVNDMPREATSKDINENYRGNYARMLAAKKQYDPTNLFRLNANVRLA